MINATTYSDISSLCHKLVSSNSAAQIIMGDAFGDELAGIEAFDSALFDHPERGKTQINATRQSVRPPFEWLFEITVRGEPFQHYLVQNEGTIVEAYAKNIIPVDQDGAEELLGILKEVEPAKPKRTRAKP